MKRVSFKVAKAIKDAGYPQGITSYQYVTKDCSSFKEGDIIDVFFECWSGGNVIDMPTHLEVWLWLWREKKIAIDVREFNEEWDSVFVHTYSYVSTSKTDPEEAIIVAINYLVENNLIK